MKTQNDGMAELLTFLDKYKVQYTVEVDNVIVGGGLYLTGNQLTSLPESFGNLKVGGDLSLYGNQLTSLPESFGNLKVGGDLSLYGNQLTSLPESFGNLKVGCGLYLYGNQLTSLPESFGNLKVGGSIRLDNNQLTSLPESFGNLKVGGGLYLTGNQLTSLPESFGNLKVGGDLYLSGNQLTSLPESFGNLKVGGDLSLYGNQLISLPESFGNLKVGGGIRLNNNQLTSLPAIAQMRGQIMERDWCYIDSVVREVLSAKRAGELTILKTPFDFIVGVGETWAHGETVAEATADYQFKLLEADPSALKSIDLDKPMSHEEAINVYRAITRACRKGVADWMNGKNLPNPITAKQIMELTNGAFGGSEFAKFFEQETQ